ncbi:O-linked N-acetylglucosamine transferase family protein [Methylophilus medardicus]|uniref:protein O-GlcNAc transferase n=1 Tax=Methylophilus medardicus TaxID=2588534 RepID=A0A5B8CSR1_9PROT|nr:tetratricopeptide repeat protein [Methylophilus medardicus]QDC44351.1 tetratricopeptide repeat protein [Methylophilus medardicus]QDC49358.1 tetratricopeptide repeat protein [Methylophilus medardicus]QDC53063.1 tetratricopeptide repeat protein [Methylophilus medardicus]
MKHSPSYKKPVAGSAQDCSQWMHAMMQAWNQAEWEACLTLAQKITQTFPEEGVAWKILGSLYQQRHALDAAADAFLQASKLLKKDAEVLYNLANVYAQLQAYPQAIKYYRHTLKLNPAFSQAYANWASVLKQTGQTKEAEKLLRRGLNMHQQDGRVNFELATLLHEAGKELEAIQYYREAAANEPENAVIYFNMAVALAELGNTSEAIAAYERVITLQKDYVEAYSHLGALYLQHGDLDEAEQWLLAGKALQPNELFLLKNLAKLYRVTHRTRDYQSCLDQIMQVQDFSPEALNNLATEMLNQQLYGEAESYCLKALAVAPDTPYVLANLGLVENARNAYDKACQYFETALKQLPESHSVWSNYSISLRMLGRFTESIACLEKVLQIKPDFMAGYINLANVYLDMGQVDTAIALLKKGLEIEPNHMMALRNLLFANSYSNTLPVSESLHYARRLGEAMMAGVTPFDRWLVHADEQRLRVGLVSADLRTHPVGYFLQQWLQSFDASRLEIYGYSTDGREDAFTHALKDVCNQWRSLAGLTDAQAAKQIHADGIHILLDLSGLSGGTRLPIFAHKPAPVQASWLGYWGTTGLPVMDYVIADPVSVDAKVSEQFTEQVVSLPHTRMCFSPPPYALPVNALPALSNGALTFGCFQNYSKVSDEVLACWGEILQALPTAKLFWQSKAFNDALMRTQALERLALFGIAATRCTLSGMVPREEYLRNHHQIDAILDTFPFTGGTTTCEALWMGVPTLTLLGDTLIARQGASFLDCVGLQDWVANSRDAYVRKAIALADDLEALAHLRAQLRAQVLASPLMNADQFAQDFEQCLFGLWQQTRSRLQPAQRLAPAPVQAAFSGAQPVWVVSATRMTEEAFWRESALGRSLKRHMQQDPRLLPVVAYENSRGLSEVFNEAIAAAPDQALLVLIHDDVWLDENTFVQSIQQGLTHFDVIGIAGNARVQAGQTGWCFTDLNFTWDDAKYLRGTVAHGQHAFGPASSYGDAAGECQLMDGVFLAAHKQTLLQSGVRFDQQFEFHFYDLDFCRSATKAGLRLGVWPVRMTHQSGGAFGTARWRETYLRYRNKWEPSQHSTKASVAANNPALQDAMAEVFDLATAAQQQGDTHTAQQLYQEILAVDGQHALALHNLGLIEWLAGQHAQALAKLAQATAWAPAQWQLLSSYLTALKTNGETAILTQVVTERLRQNQHTAALQALMQEWQLALPEVATSPADQVQNALLALFEQGHYAQMETQLHAVLGQYPHWLSGWKMLADILIIQKKDARSAASQALSLNPHSAEAHCYYGLTLKAQGDLALAADAFRQAITLKADYAAAYNNLGIVLKDLGAVEEAIQQFKQALQLQPQYADCFSNMLFCMTHAEQVNQVALFDAHTAYAALYEAPLKPHWQPHTNPWDTARPIRVGFVSGDLRAHSVAHFLLPVLPALAQDASLYLVAYANSDLQDAVTAEMQSYFKQWRVVTSLSDDALADTIRKDQIDVLIDLSGHTSGNRLPVFARKPAPVQASWLGYLNTTGLTAMDYYLADSTMLPAPAGEQAFTEQLVQLPINAPFVPDAQAPAVNALPALVNGYVTFGCFNRPNKITQATVNQWAAVMQASPGSRMVLGGMAENASVAHLQQWFSQAGIRADRLSFYPRTQMRDYLQQYHLVDICLDTFPSNGVTTTAHALWMGVPTLCVAGDRLASRGAMALMQHLGLSEWVASSPQHYLQQAQQVLADLEGLAGLRAQLRTRFAQSPLAAATPFAHTLSQALRQMWQRWCQGQAPVGFALPSYTLQAPSVAPVATEPFDKGLSMNTTLNPSAAPANALQDSIAEVFQLALQMQEKGDFSQAMQFYQEILRIDSKHAPTYFQLGLLAKQAGKAEEVLPLLEQAVILAPSQADYWQAYVQALAFTAPLSEVLEVIHFARQNGLAAADAAALQQQFSQPLVSAAEGVKKGPYIYRAQDNFYQRAQTEAFAYQDVGNAEQRLYDMIRQSSDKSVFSSELSAKATDWPSYYHLTSQRANLLRPFADKIAGGKVLELGAGCGAITRFLGELGGEVVALEGSPNRARVIGQRCADLKNVTIFSDLIQAFETEEKFDVVTLIGVLEYAQVYVKEPDPLRYLLQVAKSFLKEDGMLIVAIENQLGLKYFCGAPEDHMGQAMYGINDSYSHNTPITFGRVELDALIRSVGFETTELYVPLPDYKTPVSVIYPEGFNQAHRAAGWDVGALAAGSVVHDRQSPRHPTFSLENAWQVIARNNLVEDVANSFMFVAYPQPQSNKLHPEVLAAHYGCQRQAVFSKETQFVSTAEGLTTRTRNTGETAQLLQADWEHAPYHGGQLWMDKLTQLMNRPSWRMEDLAAWAAPWLQGLESAAQTGGKTLPEFAGFSALLPSQYFDATPTNFVMDSAGQGHFFDLEWDFAIPLPVAFVALRGLFLTLHRVRSCAKPHASTPTNLGSLTLAVLEHNGYHYRDDQLQAFISVFNRLQNMTQGSPEHVVNGLTAEFTRAVLPVRQLFT